MKGTVRYKAVEKICSLNDSSVSVLRSLWDTSGASKHVWSGGTDSGPGVVDLWLSHGWPSGVSLLEDQSAVGLLLSRPCLLEPEEAVPLLL